MGLAKRNLCQIVVGPILVVVLLSFEWLVGWFLFIIIFIFFTVFGCLLVLLSFECINWQQMDCRRRQPPLGLQLSAVDLLFNAGFLYFAPSSISGLQTVILYLQLDCLIYLIFNLPMFTEGNLLSKSNQIMVSHPLIHSCLKQHQVNVNLAEADP